MSDRSATDVVVEPVRLIPHVGTDIVVGLLQCDGCNIMPVDDDHQLRLNMVTTPDRDGKRLFLGPNCTEREVRRYLAGQPPD